LIARVALLLRAHRDDLRLGVHAGTHDLRLRTRLPHRVARDPDLGRDVLVLLRDRIEVVDAVERILERLGLDDHLDERRVVRFVQVDHPQVELMHGRRVRVPQEVQALRLERVQRVELVEPALVQLEVALENRQLLRDVADAGLERADVGGQP
jgi:hypothetical protein